LEIFPVRSLRRPLLAALVATAGLLAVLGVGSSPVSAEPTWAPEATAAIHPGVQTVTSGGQCTANFIYTAGSDVYIGQAAHCASTGGQTDTDGCLAGSQPLGTPVEIEGAAHPGVLAYSSWLVMQEQGEADADTCAYNDLALVRIDPADVATVNPTIPHWGGPMGVDTDGTTAGERVYSYGNSSLRFGVTQLSPKTGISLGSGGGWSHDVYTLSPGIPGDSGSAFLSSTGQAMGILSTLQIAPLPAGNGVGDLSHEVAYARSHVAAFADLQVVNGTRAFNGSQLPLGV
jgi:hypothetical protein